MEHQQWWATLGTGSARIRIGPYATRRDAARGAAENFWCSGVKVVRLTAEDVSRDDLSLSATLWELQQPHNPEPPAARRAA
jgi:hypothetical protein